MRLLRSMVSAAALVTGTVLGGVSPAQAASTHIAVAANFTDAATEIADLFQKQTGHEAVLSFGATGQFYTQIANGAPFEVFLAADDERPQLTVEKGYGVKDSVFTYAIGQLVLYSADKAVAVGPAILESGAFHKIAIANPATAPYGAAAVETMKALGVYDRLQPKVIQGHNIGQTFQFVQTGNAEIGFVALGQVARSDSGSRWVVPSELYRPIRQDAVLLKRGGNNPAAVAFIEFLKGAESGEIIRKYGYALDQ